MIQNIKSLHSFLTTHRDTIPSAKTLRPWWAFLFIGSVRWRQFEMTTCIILFLLVILFCNNKSKSDLFNLRIWQLQLHNEQQWDLNGILRSAASLPFYSAVVNYVKDGVRVPRKDFKALKCIFVLFIWNSIYIWPLTCSQVQLKNTNSILKCTVQASSIFMYVKAVRCCCLFVLLFHFKTIN